MSQSDRKSSRLSPEALAEVVRRLEQQVVAGADRIVDCRAALDRLDNDAELFQDLLDFFFADSPRLLAAVQVSISQGDADALHHSAHRLKGLLANFDARRAVEAAARLETLGREGTLECVNEARQKLERETEQVTALLKEFRPSGV